MNLILPSYYFSKFTALQTKENYYAITKNKIAVTVIFSIMSFNYSIIIYRINVMHKNKLLPYLHILNRNLHFNLHFS